jgi:c-di-GMP-binding flagellar brake protein YcgR
MSKTNAPHGSERRRWKRVPLDVRVKLLIVEEGRDKVIHGRSTVISEGGMGVTLPRELQKNTIATLVFTLPGETSERTMQAKLTYRSGFHCGFEFAGVTAGKQRGLTAFCAQAGKQD